MFIIKQPIKYWFISVFFGLLVSNYALAQNDNNGSAVILLYHHVSNSTPKSTSISPELFKQHMLLAKTQFNVISLQTLVTQLKADLPISDKSLVITFDDGYSNLFFNAHPILTELGLPYTVFINPDRIGKEKNQLNWDQIREMEQAGAQFANHTLDHLHMLNRNTNETEEEWLKRVWSNLDSAQRVLKSQLLWAPLWLAYPFGEYNEVLANKVIKEGYIGFGQHSGAVSHTSNMGALPRFPAAGIYSNLSTLRTKMGSLAFPILNFSPTNPEHVFGDTFKMSLSFDKSDVNTAQIQCFLKGKAITHSYNGNTLSLNINELIPIGRSRINCTAPSESKSGRFYWYSQPFFVSNDKGLFPD